MVPLLLISTNVMIAISSKGTLRPNSVSEKTSLGFGHGTTVDMRTVMYEIRKVPKMKVSLSRKIHIIGLPQGTSLNTPWAGETSATMLAQPAGRGCTSSKAMVWLVVMVGASMVAGYAVVT